MNDIKVSIAQLTPKLEDKQFNLQLSLDAMKQASAEESDLIVFPELFLTGYSVGENISKMAETVNGPTMSEFRNLCRKYKMNAVVGFAEDGQDGNYYISSAFVDYNGDVLGVYRKMHLFDKEKNYFQPGSNFEVIETPLGSVGMMICYDVEFPEIARALKLLGADLIIIVNANMHPYKEHHNLFSRCRAMENEIPVIICNRLGLEEELDFCGDSMVIDAKGEILLELEDKEHIQSVNVTTQQALDPKMSYTTNRRKEMYGILTK